MVVISVVIPVYNKEQYVGNALNDIKNQSFQNYECIIIDDGSSDRSGQICEQFAHSDSRFRVIHTNNCGVSHARNIGLKESKGKYVTFVDADDRIHKDYLNNLFQCISLSEADLVISGIEKYWKSVCDRGKRTSYRKENVNIPFQGTIELTNILPEFVKIQSETGLFGFCVSKILPRKQIGDIRFDETLKLAEDLDFYLKIYDRIDTVYFDSKPYYYYLQEAENSTVIVDDDKINYYSQFLILLRMKHFLQKRNSYFGENEKILNQKLNDYIYFTLIHCDNRLVTQYVGRFHLIVEEEHIKYSGTNLSQKYVLDAVRKKQPYKIRALKRVYSTARKIQGKRK